MHLENRHFVRVVWKSRKFRRFFCWWQRFANLHILSPQKSSIQLFLTPKTQVVIYHQEVAIWVPKPVKLQEMETPGRWSDGPLVLIFVLPSVLVVLRRLTRGKYENQWAGSHRQGWCKEWQQLMSLPELRSFYQGFLLSWEEKEREGEVGWNPSATSFPLLALLVSFHWGCFTQGASCGGFLTQMHLAWVKAVPYQKPLGLSLGKLELLAARLAFPAFGMVAGDRACHCLYMSSGEQGRPSLRVQGQVGVLCLLPSHKLLRLPSCPHWGFQPQTSPRPDRVVTALLWARGHTAEWAGDLQGLLQKDRMQIGHWGCLCWWSTWHSKG